jgi:hypothetical protein
MALAVEYLPSKHKALGSQGAFINYEKNEKIRAII